MSDVKEQVRSIIKEEIGSVTTDFAKTSDLEKAVADKVSASLEEKLKAFNEKREVLDALDSEKVKALNEVGNLKEAIANEVKSTMEEMQSRITNDDFDADTALAWKETPTGAMFVGSQNAMRHVQSIREYADNRGILKAVEAFDNAPGARQGALGAWSQRVELDPFRQFVNVMGTGEVASVTLPEWTSPEFVKRPGRGTARPDGSDLDSNTHVIENYEALGLVPNTNVGDIPGLRDTILMQFARKASGAQGKECGLAICASVEGNGGFSKSVTTGVGYAAANKGVPAAGKAVEKLAELAESLNSAYLAGAVYVINRAYFTRLITDLGAQNSVFTTDFQSGISYFLGTPIIVTDYIPASSANGKCVAVYGDLFDGIILLDRMNLVVNEYDQTNPGDLTYHAQMRFKHAIADTAAVAGMVTGA